MYDEPNFPNRSTAKGMAISGNDQRVSHSDSEPLKAIVLPTREELCKPLFLYKNADSPSSSNILTPSILHGLAFFEKTPKTSSSHVALDSLPVWTISSGSALQECNIGRTDSIVAFSEKFEPFPHALPCANIQGLHSQRAILLPGGSFW